MILASRIVQFEDIYSVYGALAFKPYAGIVAEYIDCVNRREFLGVAPEQMLLCAIDAVSSALRDIANVHVLFKAQKENLRAYVRSGERVRDFNLLFDALPAVEQLSREEFERVHHEWSFRAGAQSR